MPKASAQKFHQSNGSQLDNALLALRKDSRVLRHRRAFADCFGANPVASALGDRTRRDPDAAMRTYHVGLKQTLKTGTFYLAGNRNFLFGSDMISRLDFTVATELFRSQKLLSVGFRKYSHVLVVVVRYRNSEQEH